MSERLIIELYSDENHEAGKEFYWQVPLGVTLIKIVACGAGSGGGAGAGGGGQFFHWGSGGAGGYGVKPEERTMRVKPGDNIRYIIGVGGTGGGAAVGHGGNNTSPENDTANNGGPGGDTVFGKFIFKGAPKGGRSGAGSNFPDSEYLGGKDTGDMITSDGTYIAGGRGGADINDANKKNATDGHPCSYNGAIGGRAGNASDSQNDAHNGGGGGGAGIGNGAKGGSAALNPTKGEDAPHKSAAGGGGGAGNGPGNYGLQGGRGGDGLIQIFAIG